MTATSKEKVHLGPCKVTFDFDNETDPFVIDKTKGGVKFALTFKTKEMTTDQSGDAPEDELIYGPASSIEVPMTRKDLEALKLMIPGAELVTNGTDPTKKRVDVKSGKIISLMALAKKVVLEPLDENASPDDTIVLFNASPVPALNYTYNYDNELITNVTFKAYPDPVTKQLVGFGDPDA